MRDQSAYDEFEQALGEVIAYQTPERSMRLTKARANVSNTDVRYFAILKRAYPEFRAWLVPQ